MKARTLWPKMSSRREVAKALSRCAVEQAAVRIMRKLYGATGGQPQRWESLGNLGTVKADAAAIVYLAMIRTH